MKDSAKDSIHTEEEILEIMRRFKVNREEAMTAPVGLLRFLPEVQPPLSPAEYAYGREVANRIERGEA